MSWRWGGLVVFLGSISAVSPVSAADESARVPIVGRWDLTVQAPAGDYPSWLEVRRSGFETLVGCFVGRFGSARPISRVEFTDGQLRFAVPPQWEKRKTDLTFEGRLEQDRLSGWTTDDAGNRLAWTATRAPALRPAQEPVWGDPIALFNGTDLTGWHVIGTNQWRVIDGVLTNTQYGGNLVSDQTFTDFKLQVEFRYPPKGNSGVYLRGRYELQIEDSPGELPANDHLGAIYGFLTPSEKAAKGPGEWQTLEATLVGRLVTVVLNGQLIIWRQEIPGITGGALDSDEGAPGPLLLQGDHTAVEFRRLTLTPAK